ncbi:MAG: hypothetical protein KZQ93_02775 [Candidatus Thiodiazotropha sp. (ex Monitilora ramsayi)]|nr:hypothetical protein [Candidatus Thiodiazotropha sp. (ex Monitilora ramsayi)]
MATLIKVSIILLVLIAANILISYLISALEIQIWPEHLDIVDRAVVIGIVLYIILMAIPFLPGLEMGLILMMVLGPKGVLVTYICTLIALSIGFSIGRIFPTQLIVSLLQWLNLDRAATLLKQFDAIPPDQRLVYLARNLPKKALPILLRHRYLVLALLFNLPGNAVIGGGGGIAMIAGNSRLYSYPMFLLLISFAILPGPIVILLSKSI